MLAYRKDTSPADAEPSVEALADRLKSTVRKASFTSKEIDVIHRVVQDLRYAKRKREEDGEGGEDSDADPYTNPPPAKAVRFEGGGGF